MQTNEMKSVEYNMLHTHSIRVYHLIHAELILIFSYSAVSRAHSSLISITRSIEERKIILENIPFGTTHARHSSR